MDSMAFIVKIQIYRIEGTLAGKNSIKADFKKKWVVLFWLLPINEIQLLHSSGELHTLFTSAIFLSITLVDVTFYKSSKHRKVILCSFSHMYAEKWHVTGNVGWAFFAWHYIVLIYGEILKLLTCDSSAFIKNEL